MASELYRDHVIVCRSYYDSAAKLWLPETTVSWTFNGHYQYHNLQSATLSFDTENEANEYGFQLARTWIDRRQ